MRSGWLARGAARGGGEAHKKNRGPVPHLLDAPGRAATSTSARQRRAARRRWARSRLEPLAMAPPTCGRRRRRQRGQRATTFSSCCSLATRAFYGHIFWLEFGCFGHGSNPKRHRKIELDLTPPSPGLTQWRKRPYNTRPQLPGPRLGGGLHYHTKSINYIYSLGGYEGSGRERSGA